MSITIRRRGFKRWHHYCSRIPMRGYIAQFYGFGPWLIIYVPSRYSWLDAYVQAGF